MAGCRRNEGRPGQHVEASYDISIKNKIRFTPSLGGTEASSTCIMILSIYRAYIVRQFVQCLRKGYKEILCLDKGQQCLEPVGIGLSRNVWVEFSSHFMNRYANNRLGHISVT